MKLDKFDTSDTGVNAMNCILRPFNRAEAISLDEAAELAGIAKITARTWTVKFGLGRIIGNRTLVSRIALAAFLDGDAEALADYQRGCRTPRVEAYFQRFGIPIPESAKADG